MNDTIKAKLELLPGTPGVYKMLDAKGVVIYVGKALSLKNRVRQYFQSSKNQEPKVRAMVSHVADFEIILAASETEALTLESNLIKQYQPRYNILLKDDKHFPYVRIDMRLDYPRVEVVRRLKKDGARYLGPYLSAIILGDALNTVRDHFPVRHCKKDINKAIARKERPCLMYHVGKCCAPCSGKMSREEYHALMEQVISFLNGNVTAVVEELTKQMLDASQKMEFERAAHLRDSIQAVEKLSTKQTAIDNKGEDQDVFACCMHNGDTLVFAVFVRNGKVVGTERFDFLQGLETQEDNPQTRAEAMAAFLKQYYAQAAKIPPNILLYESAADMDAIELWLSSIRGRRVYISVPQRGEKRKLTLLANTNGQQTLLREEKLKHRAWERGEGALAALAGELELENFPIRMECFDNSHIQGRDTVSSMVVFINGAPAKEAYRRFRIKTETHGDDYAAMREALTRRFARAMDKDERFSELPDLLVIDGGRGQLNVALEVLESFGLEYIPAIGLAERSGCIYMPGRDEAFELSKNSPQQHLLERLRDEAHRFAITYHRGLRGKNSLYSQLDEIAGIGPKRKRALFDTFLTLDAISAATEDELAALVGRTAAKAVYAHFHAPQE
ncbi:excinuclease ABC subunit UvrC [Eubacteriales bacterium OttesenSCG-928-K08]|nr:excinuclease ABC subunit UvrC [Eubacteriales bacterium OttesenSCG-928-K08]